MTPRPRDSQRSKLYRSEQRHSLWRGSRPYSIEEVDDFVKKLVISQWFQRRWPAVYDITVLDGRGRRSPAGNPYERYIKMPVWSRFPLLILHEVAHVIAPLGGAWHGWEFASTYLELVNHVLGVEAAGEMKSLFRSTGVRYTKPYTRTISAETRAAAIERLALAREKKAQLRLVGADR
jgi:putative metallohydrolase (TIGR04338 family)